jgi:SAM-dependent methyltransferase
MMRAATHLSAVIQRLPTLRFAWTLAAAALSYASALAGAATSNPGYEVRAVHDPDGIGKFYMGREIAYVMGPAGIAWLERPERELEERPTQAIAALELKPGQTVVDFGAGSGYFTFRMSPLVGNQGRIVAVDIEPTMLTAISERAARMQITNVETRRSTERDPNLPAQSVDLLLMVDVYHELAFPFETLAGIREALKPQGRVALVEYRKEDPNVPIKEVHKMSERQIIRELEAAGFRHVKTISTLPLQHLVIFTK